MDLTAAVGLLTEGGGAVSCGAFDACKPLDFGSRHQRAAGDFDKLEPTSLSELVKSSAPDPERVAGVIHRVSEAMTIGIMLHCGHGHLVCSKVDACCRTCAPQSSEIIRD